MAAAKKRKAPITKIKTAAEIRHTKKAVEIIKNVFEEMRSPFGRHEADVAGEIRAIIRAHGASLAFRPIVASGVNTSHVHHRPGKRVVRMDEPALFDIGAKYRGCCSDVTRMHIPPAGSKRLRKACSDALLMQGAITRKAKPGVEFAKLQAMYAGMMKKRRYKLMHSIGHGIGLNVHERVKGGLKAGMVITIEPGIYFKNACGCRVEDDILITKGGPVVLSASIPLLPVQRL